MTYYICQRNNQCKKKCNNNCLYTSNFEKSKLYNAGIKPVSQRFREAAHPVAPQWDL